MLGRLTKTTTAQCLHLLMVAWSSVIIFCTIPNVLLLKNTNKKNETRDKNVNTLKGKLSVSMNSCIKCLSIQKLSPMRILWSPKQHRWKQELESHHKILTILKAKISLNIMLMSSITPNIKLDAQMNRESSYLQIVISLKVNLQRTKTCSYTRLLTNWI